MADVVQPLAADQIGIRPVRFPSGVPILTVTDASVDPYIKTRISKAPMVEALQFFPQTAVRYPGVLLLHDCWGLTSQVKNIATQLARDGFSVLVPNLYGRQGGMVTANAEVAAALMEQIKPDELMQDLTSCCDFLNTQDHVLRAVHAVVGFGMGGTVAIRFACHRRRLRAAVSFYGAFLPPATVNDLACPLLYHHAGTNANMSSDDLQRLRQEAADSGKHVEISTYPTASPGFCNDTLTQTYDSAAATAAWTRTTEFLNRLLK